MARKRESGRHHVLLWVLAKGAVLMKWQMLEVLSFGNRERAYPSPI